MSSHRWSARLLLWFVLLLALLKAGHPSAAQRREPGPWVQTGGPAGGVMSCIEMHPSNPEILYAGGAGGCLYKTTNGGALWQKLPPMDSPDTKVGNLSIHPTNPQTLYAHIEHGKIFKSSDGGQTWRNLCDQRVFWALAMDRFSPQRLLAGQPDGRVWYSANGGDTWSDITGNLAVSGIKTVAFGQGDEVWAGAIFTPATRLGRLYRRTIGSGSWTVVDIAQGPDTDIFSIFVDPQDRNSIYVGLHQIDNEMFRASRDVYLVKSTNNGLNWTTLRLPPPVDAMLNVIGWVPYDHTLYLGTGGNLLRSSDGGLNWTRISPPTASGDMYDLAVDPRNSRVLYLPRRAYGISKSTDWGATWTPLNEGLINTSVSLLALGNASGNTVFATSMGGEGLFRTADGGQRWTNTTAGGITHPWADELTVSPVDPRTVWYVADVGQVFVSQDAGITWSKRIDPRRGGTGFRAGTVSALAITPSDPNRIYAVKSGFGIFGSPNAGQGWDFFQASEVDYTYSLAVHPQNADLLFSGYVPKPFQDWAMVRRTQDGGTSWTTVLSVPHSSGVTSVAIDPGSPSRIYAGSTGRAASGGGAIYRSTNGGDTWAALNPHFTMLTVWGQPQLVGQAGSPNTVYAATWLAGTWKSSDAGQNWTRLAQAPQSSTALCLDPANANVIYSADRTSARVWKSSDGGATFAAVADWSSSGAFLVNRVLAAGGAVYASTFGPGLHDGKLYRSTNAGQTWADITNGLPRSVLDIAVDPSNAQAIYVTTHIYGAFKSDNGGASWSPLASFPNIGGYDIEVDPTSPSILYAAGMGAATVPNWVLSPNGYTLSDASGVYRSEDRGRTWHRVLTTSNECRAIRIHPENHNLLFAAALTDGFFVSTNGGQSWSNAYNTGLDSRNLTSVWTAGERIYVGTQGFGVYSGNLNRSTGAVTWQAARSNKPIPDVYNLQVRVDPQNSERIYVGSNPGGLFRSDDGGATWYDKNFLTPSVVVDDPNRQGYYTLAINPANPSEVWVGTWGKGVFKSYDGQDFNIPANGTARTLYGKHINYMLFHPTLGLLAATEEGVFRTADGGVTWSDFSAGLGTPQVRVLEVDATGTLFCGTAGYEVYQRRPEDPQWAQAGAFDSFGRLWPIWNNRPLYQYSTLLFHPTDARVIYFGTFPAGIFKSPDGGATWREHNVGFLNDGVFSLAFRPGDTNTVYAGTYNGVSRSTDAGAHWQRWDSGWPGEQWVFSIAFDPRDANVMYACSKNGENEGTGRPGFHGTVMKSTNGGQTWFEITTGLNKNLEFYKIIVDRFDPSRLYLATQSQGVFISRDAGAHWQAWNDGLTNLVAGTNGNNVTNCMALSDNGALLYFGSAGSGVFRRVTVGVQPRTYLPVLRR